MTKENITEAALCTDIFDWCPYDFIFCIRCESLKTGGWIEREVNDIAFCPSCFEKLRRRIDITATENEDESFTIRWEEPET